MFEISWAEIFLLGMVALVFVGPKELPVFLRTLGRYASVVRRHANEFKGQIDNALAEADLQAVREEIATMQAKVNSEISEGKRSLGNLGADQKLERSIIASRAGNERSAFEPPAKVFAPTDGHQSAKTDPA